MEAVIALAVLLKRFTFRLVPNQDIGMTTGATIHTQNGLYMTVHDRTAACRGYDNANGTSAESEAREVAPVTV
jgi:carotene epsilon-monooxygenase